MQNKNLIKYKASILNVFLLMSLLFMVVKGTHAQNTPNWESLSATSLEKIANSNQHDTIRVEALYYLLFEVFYTTSDINRCLSIGDKVFNISNAINYKKGIGHANFIYGCINLAQNKNADTTILYFQKALELYSETNNLKNYTRTVRNIGTTYNLTSNYEEAHRYFQEAYTLAKKHSFRALECNLLMDFGVLFNKMGNEDKSIEYNIKALDCTTTTKDSLKIVAISNNIAESYLNRHQVDKAIYYLEKYLDIGKKLTNVYPAYVGFNFATLADAYFQKKEYSKSKKYAKEAEKLNNSSNTELSIYILRIKMKLAFEAKEYSKAIEFAQNGIEISGESISYSIDFYEYISKSYAALGNYQQAYDYSQSFKMLSDSGRVIENLNTIQELETKYEVQQKDVENQLLKAEQKVAQKNTRNTTIIAIGLLIGLLLALGWSYAVYQANQQRKRMNMELEHKIQERTQELHNANKELQQANYELKAFNHIASHDIKEPIRNINSFVGLIQRGIPDEIKSNLDFHFKTIKRNTSQLYTLVEDFSKYTTLSREQVLNLRDVDLNVVTQSLQDNFQEFLEDKNGKIINYGLPILHTSPSMIYVTLKHLVENGLKYNNSERPTVEISYQSTDNQHQIIVSDNGIGIEKEYHERIFEMFKRLHERGAYKGSGIGLAIVKLMVEKLNGTISLESEKGKGSRFMIELPK